ncbi:MAG: lipoate protein ligase C-terminal domain-containing protein [Muribaculaceae bacterium]|nr:lipoate protein ligase C-terminal domain-containing protein [Muribaculaceae bacterium]
MIYAELPPEVAATPHSLPFYLAMEEHLARNFTGEYFVMWQVEPTVIFGRNQDPYAEVNLDYCRSNGIQFYRRRSGGGAVYADRNNIMTALITSSTEVESTFAGYCRRLADTLRSLGLDAEASGRNDVLIGGRKVSGNSFHHLPGRSIVHGTMLYDADPDTMDRALTPSDAKLHAKGVSSVRSHITTIREYLPQLSIADFRSYLRQHLSDGVMTLSQADVEEIRRIEAPYYTDEWTFGGHHPRAKRPVRIEGAGEFIADVAVTPDGRIESLSLTGDFFTLQDVDRCLLDRLRGAPLTHDGIASALGGVNAADVIAGLSNENLITLIIPVISQTYGRN